jgi:hypothetical protein
MERKVPTVRVYLTDGFADDAVIVRIDGRTVLDEQNVTTKKIYGLAKQVPPVAVDGNTAQLDVELPRRGIRASFPLDLTTGHHVPIRLENGQLRFSVQKKIGFA